MSLDQPHQAGLDLSFVGNSPEPGAFANRELLRARDWLDVLPPVAEVLFDDQRELMALVAAAVRAGHRRICVQAPTGMGKTHLIATINVAAIGHGMRVLNLATRTRVVSQLHQRLGKFGVGHGVLAAELPGLSRWSQRAQVASADTLYRRCIANRKMPLPGADVVIFDEAHLALADTRRAILNAYPTAWIFGFTATPAANNGRPLRDQFDALILGPSPKELIAAGRLVRPRIFNIPVVTEEELRDVGTDHKSDDYRTGRLSKLMSRPKLIGDVVENWLRIANGQRTIVFACDKGHGAELLAKFRDAGVAAEMLTDEDEEDVRDAAIARLESGATTVLINCFLLSYGTDIPSLQCIVIARPTRSIVLAKQVVGRPMRAYPGKSYFVLIDHGRVIDSLGHPLEEPFWSLDCPNINARVREHVARERASLDEKNRHCPKCKYDWLVSEEGSCCPLCSWQPQPKANPVRVMQADLGEMDADPQQISAADVEGFFREALSWYSKRWPVRWMEGQSAGRFWAWSQTRAKFKFDGDARMPPRFWRVEPTLASPAVAGWCLSSVIRHAKGAAKKRVA